MAILTPKENYLRALRHEETEYIPATALDCWTLGFAAGSPLENGPPGGGLDGYGVPWIASQTGGGAPLPAPNEFILEDVTEWKKKVSFPDADAYNWNKEGEECAAVDRNKIAIGYMMHVGVFERVAAFMGFENALVAMAEEPDAVNELYTAITDCKIKMLENIIKYIKPDVVTYADDVATVRNLFMSPETYRSLIKPHHKRFFDAVRNMGAIPVLHICGKPEFIVEDIIDIADAWSIAQPCNDIKGILAKYRNKLTIEGGFDFQGPPGIPGASAEVIENEVKRCYDEYGGKKGYIFLGSITVNSLDPEVAMKANAPMLEAALKFRAQGR
jgi:uroporphyrinogen-III decarboxylase